MVITSMMTADTARPSTTTSTKEGRSSSRPDLRFIPKMDARQEYTVTHSVVIVSIRSKDMILFRRLSCDRLMYASPSSTYSSSCTRGRGRGPGAPCHHQTGSDARTR